MKYKDEIRTITMSHSQYVALAACRFRIDEILNAPLPHGKSLWRNLTVTAREFARSRLKDVLYGQKEPFPGAAEYLKNIRRGRA